MLHKMWGKARERGDRIKVAFVYYSFTSFVKTDYEILSKHFDVNRVNYRRFQDAFRILIAVLKSDVSFSWFAEGHAFLAVLFSKIFRKKSIVIVGGGDVACEPEINYGQFTAGWHKKLYTKFVLKHADIVLAVSEFTKNEVLRHAKPKILKVVYNGIDTKKFEPGSEKDNNLVITVGGVNWSNVKRKGIETFVKSAKFIPEVHFVVIGKFADNAINYLRSIASSNVEFTDFISDDELVKYYQKAKVYVQPSLHEGFGCSVAEAMLCECVPVVSDRGALPEVVGDTGFYVPYGDEKATAEAIKKALNSSYEVLGKNARARIENMFPIDRREKELAEIIEEWCLNE